MPKITIEIESCRQCPFFKEGPPQSTDGFDRGHDWFCTSADKMIEPFVEWHEEKKIQIPDWCPARKDTLDE